ncbi:MAG: hypothetical protein ACRC3B_00685, partial [Bacteroidia bacterium]
QRYEGLVIKDEGLADQSLGGARLAKRLVDQSLDGARLAKRLADQRQQLKRNRLTTYKNLTGNEFLARFMLYIYTSNQ